MSNVFCSHLLEGRIINYHRELTSDLPESSAKLAGRIAVLELLIEEAVEVCDMDGFWNFVRDAVQEKVDRVSDNRR